MSLPLCLAAKILNIKIFLIEPNMVLGRANKFFLNFSKKLICYSINIKNHIDMKPKQIYMGSYVFFELILNTETF